MKESCHRNNVNVNIPCKRWCVIVVHSDGAWDTVVTCILGAWCPWNLFSHNTFDAFNNIQKHQKGGLSGKPIEKKSNVLIAKFYKLLKGKIKIIGIGGVDSGISAYDKFLAGADFIQLYTGMVFKGPNIAGIIKKDLKELLIRDGVKNFTEIVGNKTQA